MKFKVLVKELKFGDKIPKRYVRGDIISTFGDREVGKAMVLTKTRPPALEVHNVQPVRLVDETKPVKRARKVAAPKVEEAPLVVEAPIETQAAEEEASAPPAPRSYFTRRLTAED